MIDSKPVIVCVDDEATVRASLKETLKRALSLARVEVVETGEEALDLVRELRDSDHEIPVLICDHIMPGMKGDELLVRMRKELPEALLIMLSGQATPETIKRVETHARLFRRLDKPWARQELCAVVQSALELYFQRKADGHRGGP